jgi:hypothetical protein
VGKKNRKLLRKMNKNKRGKGRKKKILSTLVIQILPYFFPTNLRQ